MGLGDLHKDSILNLTALASEDDQGEKNENNNELEGNECENFENLSLDENISLEESISLDESNIEPLRNTYFKRYSSDYSLRDLRKGEDVQNILATTNTSVPETQPPNSYYSGFRVDYDDYNYNYDPYAPSLSAKGEKSSNEGGLFGCLFPFCNPSKKNSVTKSNNKFITPVIGVEKTHGVESSRGKVVSDNIYKQGVEPFLIKESRQSQKKSSGELIINDGSTDSENPCDEEEKKESTLIDNVGQENINKQSVQPKNERGEESNKTSKESIEEETNTTSDPITIGLKSILKQRPNQISLDTKKEEDSKNRRSLFSGVAYESTFEKYEVKEKNSKKTLNFAPMAKVVIVPGRHHIPDNLRKQIWWSRNDYDDFKKTGRIISRAMLEGGSEIWLSSKSGYNISAIAEVNSPGEKWWCKFGHSRRGLEHIASLDEGKHRQQNVLFSINAVIAEQHRQRRHNINDEEKLSKISSRYTNFAKNLALAAGAADADAVRSNFRAKERPHYKFLPQVKTYNEENLKALDQFTSPKNHSSRNKNLDVKVDERDPSVTVSKVEKTVNESDTDPVEFSHQSRGSNDIYVAKASDLSLNKNDKIDFINRNLNSEKHTQILECV